MSYSFPPPIPPQISGWALTANLVGMLFALVATLGVFRRIGRPARGALWFNWGIAVVLTLAVGGFGLSQEQTRLDMPAYFILVWLIIGPTCLISLASQDRPTAGAVLGWLAVIGVFVVAFLVPPLSPPRQAVWRSQCKNNLKELGTAYFESQENGKGVTLALSEGEPAHSWRTRTFRRGNRNEFEFDLRQAWNAPVNLTLARTNPAFCRCPANFDPVDDIGLYFTGYAAVTGPQSAFPNGRALPLKNMTDGISQTIVYGESAGLRIVWTEPRDIDISREPVGINLPGSKRGKSPGTLSSYHSGGATAVFADGSVRFLSDGISPAVLKALLTATGGESLSDTNY